MTPTRLRSGTVRWAALALTSTVLLTGCGAVPAFNPGVAARVADDTVSLSEVEDVTASYCAAVETQLEAGQSVPNSVVSTQVAGSLALRNAAEQFAAAEGLDGIEQDPTYAQQETGLAQGIVELPADQQEAVRAVNLAAPYVAAVELAVGEELAGGEGPEAATAAGHDAFVAWLSEQDVRIDPRFSVTIADGAVARTDTSVSVPVSDSALSSVSGEPDPAAAAALPSTQRCG
ncbi:MAG: hypothetical protein WBP61_05140 [Nocardioides sp.]